PRSPPFPYTTLFRSGLVEVDVSGVRGDQADDHVEGRGLPRPVRPQESDDLALRDVQVDLVDDAPLAKRLDEAPRGERARRLRLRSEEHTSELQSREN